MGLGGRGGGRLASSSLCITPYWGFWSGRGREEEEEEEEEEREGGEGQGH